MCVCICVYLYMNKFCTTRSFAYVSIRKILSFAKNDISYITVLYATFLLYAKKDWDSVLTEKEESVVCYVIIFICRWNSFLW